MSNKLSVAGIIDDDEVYQLVMKRTIEQSGMVESVLQFYDGEEAISYFKEKHATTEMLPGLILLDINMPYMDGWQFLDEFIKIPFREDYRRTIFIVTSSSTSEDLKKASQYSVVSGYHVKPITQDKFKEILAASGQDLL
ncbi:response regulator [Flavitalea sp. BT771]|uniref:response regulator n=1 Tax=Flavitalea sp. BT771 TaxID=3063329 RepID=UPI0026E19422|nr:response regulator [Flavitalea sp. BT771]MDO6429144.1 response regulator [Flavitalea sp. BT771]MDV6218728.1 response regulator [Flavitalea sp. BT771]